MRFKTFTYPVPPPEELEELNAFLASTRILDLSLKGNGQINRTQKGMGFLESVVHPGFLRLSSRTQKWIRQKFKSREKDFQKGLISKKVLQHDVQSLWTGERGERFGRYR